MALVLSIFRGKLSIEELKLLTSFRECSPPSHLFTREIRMIHSSTAHFLCFVTLIVVAICAKPPNIVLIVSDDQDTHMESVEHMPLLKKHLIFEGTTFPRHYCTVTLCCPSRVSLLTGKLAHNTNVTDIWAPYGQHFQCSRSWQRAKAH